LAISTATVKSISQSRILMATTLPMSRLCSETGTVHSAEFQVMEQGNIQPEW
jgi:hypothetical protein